MSIYRKAARRDMNEPMLKAAAEKLGIIFVEQGRTLDWSVQYGEIQETWEFKGEKGQLTESQIKAKKRGVRFHIIRNLDDIAERFRVMREKLMKLAR